MSLDRVRAKRAPRPPRPAPADPSTTVGVRIPASMLAKLDALAEAWSTPGFAATRSDVLRVLVTKGLTAMAPPAGAPQ